MSKSKVEALGRCFKRWEKPADESSGCNKSSGDFTGYQSCDFSDILLLEDDSDGHTHRPMAIDWHRTDIDQNFLQLETVQNLYVTSCQLNGKVCRTMSQHNSFRYGKNSTTHREIGGAGTAGQFQLRSSFIKAAVYWSVILDDIKWPWSDFLVCAQPNRIQHQLIFVIEPLLSSFVQSTSLLHIPNDWSVRTNTRRSHWWHEEAVKWTLRRMYANS